MNLKGNSIIVKKRALDPELRSDITALMCKAQKLVKRRDKLLRENPDLVKQVKWIKRRIVGNMGDAVFSAIRKLRENGISVFLAKKPIDVAEYIRGFIGRERLGIVPSPQTMEAEVMQAFFMSNKVQVLSERYSGYEKGRSFIHPYFPYPQEKSVFKRSETRHAIISAVAVTDAGNVYLEAEEGRVMDEFSEPFVITTVDRLFSEEYAESVVRLMEISSGGAIKTEKMKLKGRLIVLDNGRIAIAHSPSKEVLMCINCYSCSLYCPVYLTIGGLFGSPMMSGIGSLSVGYQSGIKAAINRGLDCCMLCGKCEKVCPTDVPVVKLIRIMRKRARTSGL